MKSTTPAGPAPPGHAPLGQNSRGRAEPLKGNKRINEANVSTEQQTTQTYTRISRPHEQRRRSAGLEKAACQGPEAADGQHSTEAAPLSRSLGGERLPKSRRIRKRPEFLRLQRVGRRRAGRRFVVITEPVRTGGSRIGITASRHVGGAVVRNRVKRLVREFFRRHQHRIMPPQDVLVIARPAAASADYADVKRELAGALKIDAQD